MLDNLPPEILEEIIGYVPSASTIVSLDCVNRKLHATISANSYALFRRFVQSTFPTVRTPPLWREMAKQLTLRSRAWDRRAFIARECYPDTNDASGPPWLDLSSKFGYTPVIDSYEEYVGASTGSRRNVLAYGAAGRLRLRISEKNKVMWSALRLPDDHLPQHDVVEMQLLKPHDHPGLDRETLIVRRADRSLTKVSHDKDTNDFTQVTKYNTGLSKVDCIDISTGVDAHLAVFDKKTLQLFPLHVDTDETLPTISTPIEPRFGWQNRRRCAKFLTNDTIATAVQFVQGPERAPILIYDITPSNLVSRPLTSTHSLGVGGNVPTGRHSATVITKIDPVGFVANRPGEVFLSGWTDACVRLHDLRTPHEAISTYWDPVDNGKILSLATYGHEKFFAGSHQNGCLKMFDMRMPGARPYSCLNVTNNLPSTTTGAAHSIDTQDSMQERAPAVEAPNLQGRSPSRKDINIFLALTVNQRGRLWEPLPPQNAFNQANTNVTANNSHTFTDNRRGARRQRFQYRSNNNNNNYTRYRGSVYSLSTPSPSSTTLFAGIENHVIQLDFLSTDDIQQSIVEIPPMTTHYTTTTTSNTSIDYQTEKILNLSCYERPRQGHESTDPVLLRKQLPWSSLSSSAAATTNADTQSMHNDMEELPEEGWDARWRLGKRWKRRDS